MKKLVMIGNSYTFYYKMPEEILLPLLEEAGWEVSLCCLTKGGQFLLNSANPEDVLGVKVKEALEGEHFDYAIIQEQSTCAVLTPEKFYRGVNAILERIRPTGAKTYLYSTWGRKEGSPFLEAHQLSANAMTSLLVAVQEKGARDAGIQGVFVGKPFEYLTQVCPEIELYQEDKSHPSYEGSFLAGLCLAAALTGKDPKDFKFCGTLSPQIASVLKEAASMAL